jgi:hypothetical protein
MNTALTSTAVNRAAPWHGQWHFCGRFHLAECHALRRLDHDWIDRVIRVRRLWGQRPSLNYGGSWRNAWEPVRITDEDVQALHAMCDFLLSDPTPRKIMIRDNNLHVYANDQDLYQCIIEQELATFVGLCEVNLTGSPNTVRLRSSDHGLRSYFRGRKLDASTARSVRTWLLAQQSVRLSPSLRYWCENKGTWLFTYYFLDHDSASTVDMLQIIAPGIIRCTLPIVTDK